MLQGRRVAVALRVARLLGRHPIPPTHPPTHPHIHAQTMQACPRQLRRCGRLGCWGATRWPLRPPTCCTTLVLWAAQHRKSGGCRYTRVSRASLMRLGCTVPLYVGAVVDPASTIRG